MALDEVVPIVGPRTAIQFGGDINEELAELYARSAALVTGVAGTNTITGTVTPARGSTRSGNGYVMQVANTNSGAVTFNGKAMVTSEGGALQSGQITAGQWLLFVYDSVADHYRILTPLSAGTAPVVRVYTAGATWTKPSGIKYALIRVQAAGGGGGGTTANTSSFAGGGGAGSYGERTVAAASLGATETVTINAAGLGFSSANGSAGGTASFGALVTCNGGAGGLKGTGASANGGAGGTAGAGGDINLAGQAGGAGGGSSGTGGQSEIGGAGGASVTTGTGNTAPNYGGGGGGSAITTSAGGDGGPGIVIVTEYYS